MNRKSSNRVISEAPTSSKSPPHHLNNNNDHNHTHNRSILCRLFILVCIFVCCQVIVVVNSSSHFRHDSHRSSSSSKCSKCALIQENAKARRIEEFKRDFLSKLGMKEPPKISFDKSILDIPPINQILQKRQNTHFPHHMDMDGMMSDQPTPGQQAISSHDDSNFNDADVYAKKSISLAQNLPESVNISGRFNAQYFKFSPHMTNLHVSRATLWVQVRELASKYDDDDNDEDEDDGKGLKNLLDEDGERGKNHGWIVIDQFVKSKAPHGDINLSHVRSRKVHLARGTSWVKVSVKKLVNQWLHAPKENLGLVIHVYDSEGRLLPSGSVAKHAKSNNLQVPFIEVHMSSKGQARRKRMAGLTCDATTKEVRCCKYPLTVNFTEFGWHWVIAPHTYEANYCAGQCGLNEPVSPYAHLIKQSMGADAPGPCCVPKKTSSFTALHLDEDGLIHEGVFSDLVVDSCGCV